ncbi:hypothetical protein FB451DRAFT_1170050 [Mycena latifolia]|nr:hypothetical protein FB451DRAFT_1170050 [Mycena latifolia]
MDGTRGHSKADPKLRRGAYHRVDESWPEQADIIRLVHLKHLFVTGTKILKYLRTPALQEIALRIYDDDPDLPDLDSFVARSACNLRRLCFKKIPDPSAVREILHKYPSITELAILPYAADLKTGYDAADSLLSHFTIPNSTSEAAVAPHLCAIEFGCAEKTSIDYALYLTMIKSRWRAPNCALRSAALIMNSGPGPTPATLHGLDSLRKDGLDLQLLYGDEAVDVMDCWTYNAPWI